MRNILKKWYYDTKLGYFIISFFINVIKFFQYQILPEKLYLTIQFKKKLNYSLNLDNPQTLNEKIQWLKINDRSALHTKCSDKFAVREYVKQEIGAEYLIPLQVESINPSIVNPQNMPPTPYIIKVNHNSGGTFIVKDEAEMDWVLIRKKLSILLKENYYYRTKEWQYKNIVPRVIIEKLLLDDHGNLPMDYKFHCFNGQTEFIQVDIDRNNYHRRNLYDTNWKFIDCTWKFDNGPQVAEPIELKKMLLLASRLSKMFRYVRVDFYNIGHNVYFGELTFHPGSGFENFTPFNWDQQFGAKLIL